MMKSAGSCILCTAGEPSCCPCKGSCAVLLSPHAACPYRYRQLSQSRNIDEGSLPFRLRNALTRHPYPLFGQSCVQVITSITLALMMTCSIRNWWWLS